MRIAVPMYCGGILKYLATEDAPAYFAAIEDGKLVGYAVVRSDTDPQDGLRKSVIADTLVRQDDPEIVKALWTAAYETPSSWEATFSKC